MRRTILPALALLGSLFACSTPSTSTCVPGASAACTCIGGGSGAQLCLPNGTFDVCQCGASTGDAYLPIDGSTDVDSATPHDAGSDLDAEVPDDTGVDASVTPGVDSGVVCPVPFLQCDGECIDPRTSPDHCGATGTCTGASDGMTCAGACNAGRCVWDSCALALEAGGSVGDGVYLLDVDGSGPLLPGDAYCDMTTDGGGWTLVYKIRNDIPDISDPWWGMVALGSSAGFPVAPTALPAVTHFEGPTREVRAALWARGARPTSRLDSRVTVLRASDGMRLFELQGLPGAATVHIMNGSAGVPLTGFGGAEAFRVTHSSSGLPAVGTTGTEQWITCTSGTCQDFALLVMAAGGPSMSPLYGDATVGAYQPAFANSTTLFWTRFSTP